MKTSQIIWDFPTRAFHWLLVLTVAGGLITGFLAPDSWLMIHVWFGTAVLALITFRLIWGLVGSYHSRFSSFIYSRRETRDHILGLLKRKPSKHLGHNPLGALMIFILIGTLLVITLSGFVVLGGEEKQGPLAGVVPYFIGKGVEDIHETLAGFLLFLIGGHLFGVVVESLLSKENLAKSMVTGRKAIPDIDSDNTDTVKGGVHRGVSVAGVVGLVVVLALFLIGIPTISGAVTESVIPTDVSNTQYSTECGDCHHAFHPSLLPKESWFKMMNELDNHFGEDASLDGKVVQSLEAFLINNSSEIWDTRAANLFRNVNPKKPLQITATKRWKHIHEDVPDTAFQHKLVGTKTNCAGCHSATQVGMFADYTVQMPKGF